MCKEKTRECCPFVKEVFVLWKKDTFVDNSSAGWHGIKIGRGCQEGTLVFSEKILPGRTVVGIT